MIWLWWAIPLILVVFLWHLNDFLRGSLKEITSVILTLIIFALIVIAFFVSGWIMGIAAIVGPLVLCYILRPLALALAQRLITSPDLHLDSYSSRLTAEEALGLENIPEASQRKLFEGSKMQIKELAITVNEGLLAYIAVHDKIFKEAATLTSLFKNISGHGVPMSELLEQAEELVPLWDSISAKVESFQTQHGHSLSKGEMGYMDILSRYVGAVRKTVATLVERQRLLKEGSKGGSDNPMTWDAYKIREAEYQAAVQEYMAIGQELNAASPLIFSS